MVPIGISNTFFFFFFPDARIELNLNGFVLNLTGLILLLSYFYL